MENYNILLNKYLNNEITDPNLLKKLYNDKIFMKLLIRSTRDVKYYNLCSHELKTNIDFVIFLTNIFDNDLNLTFNIINYYIYSVGESDPKFPRLLVKIDSYLKYREFEFDVTYYMQYRCKIIYFVEKYQTLINSVLERVDDETRRRNSLGFRIIQNEFPSEQTVQEFFAKRNLDKIFYEYDFEDYIHAQYSNLDKLNKKSDINILMDYIMSYDIHLGAFASNNPDILKDKYVKLNEVKDNFENYIQTDIRDKIDKFNTKLSVYMEEEEIDMTYVVDIIKLEEIKRLGLSKEFYGEEVKTLDFITNETILDFKMEKLRLYIRTELQNLFKNKTRKLEMKIDNNDD